MTSNCEHGTFVADVDVKRLLDFPDGLVTSYSTDIRIQCADCGTKMQFVGIPTMGVSNCTPTVSVDGFELRAPIIPCPAINPIGDKRE